jgi:hypothetical protein
MEVQLIGNPHIACEDDKLQIVGPASRLVLVHSASFQLFIQFYGSASKYISYLLCPEA